MTNLKKRERAKTNASLISMVQRFSDITIMFAGLWLVCEVSGLSFLYMHLLVALITLVMFQMLGGITDFYRSWRGVRAATEFALLLQNWTLSVIFSAGLVAFNNDFDTQLKIWLAWYGLTSIGLVVCRSCIRIGAGWLRNHGYNKRMVAVAGDLAAGQMLMESFRNQPWLGFEVVGVYHDPKPGGVSNDWAGNLQQLVEDAKAGKIHNVYIAMQMCDGARVKKLVHQLADTTCSVLLIPDVFTFNILHSRLEEMNGVPVVPLYDTPLSGVNRLLKRAEDIVLATLILLLISPVLCCIALAVKLSSPGPVIFRQTRYGMDGKPIKVWKFRSMKVMENDKVVTQATQNDPRVTKVGNFLRRTSLDELPQFINVLTGGMSIVGPRPHAVAHNEQYRQLIQDGSQVTGEEGGSMHNITLDVRGSDCTIKGLTMTGFGPVTQIYIGGKNKRVMRNLTIDNLTVSHANYAILRQGFHNQIIGANITNCKFSDLQGDAIEWNVAINDSDILISDHIIERINCTNGKINWGIGIGLAGSTYDNNYPEDQAVKNFVVANITGSDCRQLIHVENGKHFVIRNIKARNITPDFSKKAGIDNATVAIYGCDNFVIDNIEMINSAGMLIGYGVIKGKYLSIPQNFRVNNIQLDNTHLAYKLRGIQISAGNAVSFVALTNIEMKRASLELHNKPQHLFIRNINVMQESSVGPALSMNFDMRKDVRGVFMAKKETLLSLANVHAVNEKGQSSVDIDRIDNHIVNVEKINFRLPERRE